MDVDQHANLGLAENIKPAVLHNEEFGNEKDAIPLLTDAQRRRLAWKTDLHVLPMLAVVYALSIIDKTNIGAAKVLGMVKDLHLGTGPRYSIILLLFFPAYALSDIPSNWLLVRLSPRYWLSFLIFAWGLVLLGMGFNSSWKVMVFLRFLLGLFEGGVFPAMVFILSSWYPRYQLHRRIGICYALATLSSACSGFLSYALGLMAGDRGMSGWRWIFSIEGAASAMIGLIAIFFLPSFPDKATWLQGDERAYLAQQLNADRGDFDTEHITWKSLKEACKDWTVWAWAVIFCFNTSTVYSLSFFSPSILQGLGYSGLKATLHSAYPYLATIGALGISSYISDKTRHRSPVIVAQLTIMLVGYVIIQPGHSTGVRYTGIFLATMGSTCNAIAILVLTQNNAIGSAKRNLTSAIIIGFGVTGGIIGSTIFRAEDAPDYIPGIYTTIAMTAFNLLATVCLACYYIMLNRKADRSDEVIGGIVGFRYSW